MGNLFFFWGQEEFLLNSEIEQIKNKNIDKNFEVMSYRNLNKPKPDEIITAIRALPMMFGNVMHVIDMEAFLLSKKGESADSEDGDNSNENISDNTDDIDLSLFERALQNMSDKNFVVLKAVIPIDSKKKIDTRKKIYKIISKYAQEKQFPLYKPYDKELPNIITNLGKNHRLNISRQVASTIIEQIGTNLGIINSELSKLAITIYPQKEPNINDVQNICTQKDDVFVILDAVFNNNMDKALIELKKVFEKTHYLQVLGAIQQSLRNFMLIKIYFQKYGKSITSQKMGLHEFIVEKNYNSMSNITTENLYKLKQNLIKAEYSIKNGDAVNPEQTIEMGLLEI